MNGLLLSLDLPSALRASCIYNSWQPPLSHCISYARRLGFDYSPEHLTSARQVACPVCSKESSTAYRNLRILALRAVSALNCTIQNDVDSSLIRRKPLVFPRQSTFSQCLAVSAACICLNGPLKSMCLTEATKFYSLVQVSQTLEGFGFTSIKFLLAAVVLDPQEPGSIESQT